MSTKHAEPLEKPAETPQGLPFEPFQKIDRLKRGCVVTEKIDGTNAQIAFADDGTMFVGSRSRWITPESDNFGFARWAHEHADDLRKLGPGRHFGEWWGAGIQRRYGLAEKRFSLFNTARWSEETPPACCLLVPVLYKGPFSSSAIDEVLHTLAVVGSFAAPGFLEPEGIVVYLPHARSLFKVTIGDDGHKGTVTP